MSERSSLSLRTAAEILGDRVAHDVPIGAMTTYRVGGSAALFIRADSAGDLDLVARAVAESQVDVLILGLGSNLLIADAGFDGLVVALGEGLAGVTIAEDTVRAEGAARLPVVARQTVAASLTGFEWAVGIPGSVGGAVRMNAGGHGSEISDVLSRIRVVDLASGEHRDVPSEALDLRYRHSALTPTQVVLWAEFELAGGDRSESERRLAEIVRWRRDHHPGGANAGSVFTNPPGHSAGRLIEQSGAKGLRFGSAQVSTKHANFIQADAGGSADDVAALMAQIRTIVAETTGVLLVPETRLVGFADDVSAALTADLSGVSDP